MNRLCLVLCLLPSLCPILLIAEEMEVAQFIWFDGRAAQPLGVIAHQDFTRIDTPERRFSVISRESSQDLIGLEHRDGRYWKFNWRQLKQVVKDTKRNARTLKSPLISPSAPPEEDPSSHRWLWKETGSMRMFGPLEAYLWEARDPYDRTLQSWCTTMPGGPSLKLWQRLSFVQDVLALVAIRPLGPGLPPAALEALPASVGNPIEVSYGSEDTTPRLTLKKSSLKSLSMDVFVPPENYKLDPLSAIDGMR
jgi:hypothetical protein